MRQNNYLFAKITFTVISSIILIIALFLIYRLNILALKNLFILTSVLILIFILLFVALFLIKSKWSIMIAVLILLLNGVGIAANFVLYTSINKVDDALGLNQIIKEKVLVSLKAKEVSLENLSNQKIGANLNIEYNYLKILIQELNTKVNDYILENDNGDLINALDSGKYLAIIIDKNQIPPTEEGEESKYQILLTKQFDQEIVDNGNLNLDQDPFILYVSGSDSYGDLSNFGHNDVNLLASINPKTKQVFLFSTPRDSYIKIPCFNNVPDKLTHSGTVDIKCSIDTLQELYDIKINYYLKVNFTSVRSIVDEIGGIDLYNEQYFNTFASMYEKENQFEFKVGDLHLNGHQALSYVRERQYFGDERMRGVNQEKVIKAIVKKMSSPSVLLNYQKVLQTISKSFESNLTVSDLSKLAQLQQNDNRPWTFVNYTVEGTFGNAPSINIPSIPYLSVFYPNTASVDYIKQLIKENTEGKVLEIKEVDLSKGKYLNYEFDARNQENKTSNKEETEEKQDLDSVLEDLFKTDKAENNDIFPVSDDEVTE